MSTFHVGLKKVVDESYDIQVGYDLQTQLIEDIKAGLVGNIKKFAVIADSIVNDLYAEPINTALIDSEFQSKVFVFPEGEKSKTRETKAKVEVPTKIPAYINRASLVKKLYTDKKVRDGKLRFVLQDSIGSIKEFEPGVFAKPIDESLAREVIMEM